MAMGCGGCASAGERCGNGLEKIYPTTAVRFGRMRHIGEFSHPPDMKFSCGAKVVIATDRGIEIGDQVSLTCFGCDKSVTREQIRSYAETSGGDTYRLKAGRILREATEPDLAEWKHIEGGTFDILQTCRQFSRELELDMKIVDAEHIFGGERVVFYFMSEERIDFRQLVHRLAGEFRTRIEMRQVGARDEARLVADYETCGRECCCKNFLKTLKPISMSMAKLQKTTLDLSKVSGRCGRLKCCLRYEHEGYESLEQKLPRMGTRIKTAHGTGQVVDRQILTQLVKIKQDDGRLLSVVVEDILESDLPQLPAPNGVAGEEHPRPRGQVRQPQAGAWVDDDPTYQEPNSMLPDMGQKISSPDAFPSSDETTSRNEPPPAVDPEVRPHHPRHRRRRKHRGQDPEDRGSSPPGSPADR